MNILIAIDSFKGSLSSKQAGNAVKEAIMDIDDKDIVNVLPLADGGEGTVQTLHEGLGGALVNIEVSGPLLNKVNAQYCILDDNTAVIEMASASGLTLISKDKLNPLETTTYGVGEMINDAISRGCRNFIIGIGGSATNDGGTGMLTALGYELLDREGKKIPLGAKGLEFLYSISTKNVIPELKNCIFNIACDVTNPLCGINGCSEVFARQKGADSIMIKKMDSWLANYAVISKQISKTADAEYEGAGAAGGLGFAFLSFTNAKLESGIKIILDKINMEEYIKCADIVVTGEGRLDSQTVMGKAPIGVAKIAKKYGKRVIAFSGIASDDATVCNQNGIDAFFPIMRNIVSLEDALNPNNAYKNLYLTAGQVFRLIKNI